MTIQIVNGVYSTGTNTINTSGNNGEFTSAASYAQFDTIDEFSGLGQGINVLGTIMKSSGIVEATIVKGSSSIQTPTLQVTTLSSSARSITCNKAIVFTGNVTVNGTLTTAGTISGTVVQRSAMDGVSSFNISNELVVGTDNNNPGSLTLYGPLNGNATWNGNTIPAQYGGTGITSYTSGDILYASGTTTLSKFATNSSSTPMFLSCQSGVLSWKELSEGLSDPTFNTITLSNTDLDSGGLWIGSDHILSSSSLGSSVTSSSLNSVANLTSGSIESGFGPISIEQYIATTDIVYAGGIQNNIMFTNDNTKSMTIGSCDWNASTFFGAHIVLFGNDTSLSHPGEIQLVFDKQNSSESGLAVYSFDGTDSTKVFAINQSGKVSSGEWNATTIATTSGGTGLVSYNAGDLVYASETNVLSCLAANNSNTNKYLRCNNNQLTWSSIPAKVNSFVLGTTIDEPTEIGNDVFVFPANIGVIQISFYNMSKESGMYLLQIGTLSGLVTSGYNCGQSTVSTETSSHTSSTNGFCINTSSSVSDLNGQITLTRVNTYNWTFSGNYYSSSSSSTFHSVGVHTGMSQEFTRLAFVPASGKAFGANSIVQIYYS